MSERRPQQERSRESTNRMLDAAEQILFYQGPDALTIEAVIEKAATSTGAFYARFENREGLAHALHERFLERVGAEMFKLMTVRVPEEHLEADIANFISALYLVVDKYRPGFYYFAIHNSFNAALRQEAEPALQAVRGFLEHIYQNHQDEWRRDDSNPNFEHIWRLTHGIFLDAILYREEFMQDEPYESAKIARELAATIVRELHA